MCIAFTPSQRAEIVKFREGAADQIETILFNAYLPSIVASAIVQKVSEALARPLIIAGLGELPAVQTTAPREPHAQI